MKTLNNPEKKFIAGAGVCCCGPKKDLMYFYGETANIKNCGLGCHHRYEKWFAYSSNADANENLCGRKKDIAVLADVRRSNIFLAEQQTLDEY